MKNLCSQKIRKNSNDTNESASKKKSKYTPYTKLSDQELIDIARKLEILNQKVNGDKMQSVSDKDKDLRKMFDNVHKGMIEK